MAPPIRLLQVGTDLDVAGALDTWPASLDVVSRANAEAGLDSIVTADIDCVVSSAELPETSGLDFLESVRGADASMPFVLVLDGDCDTTVRESIEQGVTDVVERRPDSDDALLVAARVRNAVDRESPTDDRESPSDGWAREHGESNVAHLPVGVFRATLDGAFVDVNDAFVSLVGGDSKAEVLGSNSADLYAEPEAREGLTETLRQEGVIRDREVKLRTLSGDEIWVSTTLRLTEVDGQQYLDGISQDITDRKERERELRRKEERYRNLVEDSPAPINLFDADGASVWGNDALLELLGLDRLEELQGRSIFDFIHPDDHAIAETELEGVIEAGTTAGPTRFRLVRDDDETRHVQVKTTAGWYQGERVGQAVVVDVTELREARERIRENERRYRTLVEMSPGPILVHADGEIVYVNDAMVDLVDGTDRDELVGTNVGRYLPETAREAALETAAEVQRGEREITRSERDVQTLTGDIRRVETTSRAIAYEGTPAVLTVIKDITERYRHEQMLTTLHDRMQAMTRAESRSEIAGIAAETADELLDADASVVYEFDGTNTLVPLAWSTSVDEAPPSQSAAGAIWEAFVAGERRVVDGESLADLVPEVELESALVLPVETHGVLVAGSVRTEPLVSAGQQIAGLIRENLGTALDRAGREAALLERDRQLQRQNDALEQVNRLNDIIREVNQTLVRSTSRSEIRAGVCEQFAATEQYAFAWIADRAPTDGTVSPAQWSSIGPEFVDHIDTSESAAPLRTLVETAFRSGSVQVAQRILDDPGWSPHRSDALREGYRAIAAVPVIRGETIDSVLVIHAEDGDIFDDHERAVLTELGRTIGYALRNVDRVDAIVSGERTEVELSIADERLFTNRIAAGVGCAVEFVGAIPDDEGDLRVFLRLRGETIDVATNRLEALESVRSTQPLSVDEQSALYQIQIAVPALVELLRGLDVGIRSLKAEDGTTRLSVVLTGGVSVRTLVEELQHAYPETELLARRDAAAPVDTRETFRDRLVDQLTEKQLDALQTAHYGGFFEWPRAATSEELAGTRDIAASTFQYHLRAAERKLISAVLDTL